MSKAVKNKSKNAVAEHRLLKKTGSKNITKIENYKTEMNTI